VDSSFALVEQTVFSSRSVERVERVPISKTWYATIAANPRTTLIGVGYRFEQTSPNARKTSANMWEAPQGE
jgi:hypothetical protein